MKTNITNATYSSGITTKLSLQNLPPDDCLRFVMEQETECGATLLAAVAPHSVNKIWQRHLTCKYRSKCKFVVPAPFSVFRDYCILCIFLRGINAMYTENVSIF